MLKFLRARIVLHREALGSCLAIFKNQWGSTAIAILILAWILILPLLCWVSFENLKIFTQGLKQTGQISLYLRQDASPKEVESLLISLKSIPGVKSSTWISPQNGLEFLKKESGLKDITELLPNNPLPGVIDITRDPNINTMEQEEALYLRLRSLPLVDYITQDSDWTKYIFIAEKILENTAWFIALLLAVGIIAFVANTLKSIVQSRIDEIKILKLLGAQDAFIRRPFLYLSILYAVLGSSIALIISADILFILKHNVADFFRVYDIFSFKISLSLKEVVFVFLVSVGLSWFAAQVAIRKELIAH